MRPLKSLPSASGTGRWLVTLALCTVCAVGTTEAKAPKGRYRIADGEVTDTKTQLVWRQVLNPAPQTHEGAIASCAALGGTWRTPNVKELFSLVDESTAFPAIDEDAFPDTPPTEMWSSTPLAGDETRAWTVDFATGNFSTTARSEVYQVRCVR